MKRFADDRSGGDGQRRTRQREVDNPYLAHGQRRERKQVEEALFSRRRRRDARALFFHQDAEEEEEQAAAAALAVQEREQQRRKQGAAEQATLWSSSTANAASSAPAPPLRNLDTPGLEWWDVVFLPKEMRQDAQMWNPETAPYDQLSLSNQKTTLYVEHPVPIQPTKASTDSNEPLKLYQTKAELKRIRRLNRAMLNKEKQDKIALGLMPPPPPKVRISNLLRVLSAEHAADPSMIEAKVKAEMEQRERQHLARNMARMLTPAERAEKVKRRIQRDAENPVVHIAVFRITNMELMQEQLSKKRMVKMSLTAKKLMINGRVIVVRAPTSIPTLVYVEGGPKSIRKFARLMLRRIQWSAKTIMEASLAKLRTDVDEDTSSSSSDESSSSSSSSSDEDEGTQGDAGAAAAKSSQAKKGVAATCSLVWAGTSARREFDGFRREVVDAALDARQLMQSKGLGHLWDAVVSAPAGAPDDRIALEGII